MNVIGPKRPHSVLEKKLARLASGEPPRVIDLFAGCGGISLGFQRAGFRIDAAVEIEPLPAAAHALNFHRNLPEEMLAAHSRPRDITVTEPEEVTEELRLGESQDAFDVVVGGPPCQAYARIGRAKLREVAEHPSAFKIDPRANLWLRYLAYVEALQPLVILMENVPDILNFGGHNVVAEMADALTGIGYNARYTLINSAFHGVPQMRDRVFLLAYHRDLAIEPMFPKPTRHMVLPRGYMGTRSVALWFTRERELFDTKNGVVSENGFVDEDMGTPDLDDPVTASEALGDLPEITGHLRGEIRRGARRFDKPMSYRSRVEPSAYALEMRQWPGHESRGYILDHVIRYLPRDIDIFRKMRPGDEYPAAHALAVRLAEQEVNRRMRRGEAVGPKGRAKIMADMVPPYDPAKFPNKWWKLRPDGPSRTLTAHIGKDTYSHIHYDGSQARTISVREAARIQSFPDGFVFTGTMNPAFRMIGNSVPPLVSFRIAEVVKNALDKAAERGPLQPALNQPAA